MNTIAFHTLYALCYLLSLLPLRVLYVMSDITYLIVAHLLHYRRKVIRKNIASSFPEKSKEEQQQIERDFYRYFCDYFFETIKLASMSAGQLKRRMTFTGMEEINRVLNSGQSCAIYLGHYGNWEWLTSLPLWVPEQVQCGQIYHPLENEATNRLFLKFRQHFHSRCIAMNDTLREIVRFQQEGTVVAIGYISDQCPHWVNIHHWVDFLNHDTPVLTGVERIVRKVGHAVFYGDMRRVRRGYYTCEIRLITDHPEEAQQWDITDRYFRELENTIRRAPQYYLWSHNRWKRTREEFNRRFEYRDGKVIGKGIL